LLKFAAILLALAPLSGGLCEASPSDAGQLLEVIVKVPEGAPPEVVREQRAPPEKLSVRIERGEDGFVKIRLVNFNDADVRFAVRADRKNPNGCGLAFDVLHPTRKRPVHLSWFDCSEERQLNAEQDFPPAAKWDGGGGICDVPQCYEITNLPFMPAGAVPDGGTVQGSPLQIAKEREGKLVLSWDPSCIDSDVDYEIYEGSLQKFGSHTPILCSTQGSTTKIIDPGKGNRYYLIVPRNEHREGSYGMRSDRSERGQGSKACLIQQTISCTAVQ